MKDFSTNFFGSNFMPHGHCYYWEPTILWSHAISDGVIALAYCAIPLTLVYIFRKRNDFKFIWMMILFAIFILGCGITHVFDVINIWKPFYVSDSIFRIITALASIGTAVVLVRITPSILKIPTTEQWININKELNQQINQLKEKDRTIEKIREFEFLSNFIPQIVWGTDAEGNANYFNKKWLDYTGISAAESKNQGWQGVIHPEDFERSIGIWSSCLQTGESYEIEYRLKSYDGTFRWFLGRGLPMKDEQGRITKWLGTCTDIEDQKKFNEELQLKNRELEIINNDLDNFVYTASHDLKSPITNLEGLFNLLTEQVTSENSQFVKTKEMVSKSISRLKNTIEDLGDISRVQRGAVEEEWVNVPTLYSDVRGDLHSLLEDSLVTIQTNFEVDEIKFSKKNLRTIVYNLLSNAIKYRSADRPPVVTLSTYYQENYVVVSVKDNGLGIESKGLQKIFGMFKRLHDHVEGTGIGLYIVKKIVDNHHGKIEVTSALNEGSEFKIYLRKQ